MYGHICDCIWLYIAIYTLQYVKLRKAYVKLVCQPTEAEQQVRILQSMLGLRANSRVPHHLSENPSTGVPEQEPIGKI